MRTKDISGQKFGKLTAIKIFSRNPIKWLCLCECGKEKIILLSYLTSGDTKSCGCLRKKNLTGQVFGRLTVVGLDESNTNRAFWICNCECGNEFSVRQDSLLYGEAQSCGCVRKENGRKSLTKHGLSFLKAYQIWLKAYSRCYNKDDKSYNRYGGRGIIIQESWIERPELFVEYVENLDNYDTPGYSIDRIDNNKGYIEGNIKFSNRAEQSRNREFNKLNMEKAKQIRELYSTGNYTNKEIALIVDTTYSAACNVIYSNTWVE